MTLAEYHNVIVMSDDIDATEIALEDDSVDSYMEDILHVWGIQWEKVCELAEALQKPQSQQTGQKRLERTDREEKKRPRENKRNEANDILVDSMPDRG